MRCRSLFLVVAFELAVLAAAGSAPGRAPRALRSAAGGVRRIGQVSVNALKKVGGAFRLAFLGRMAEHSGLSGRGVVSMTPVRDDLEEFFAAWRNPFDPSSNQDGFIVLLVAENKLTWSMLQKRLEAAAEGQTIPAWVVTPCRVLDGVFGARIAVLFDSWDGYGDFRGEERFRAALAGMMETTFVHAPVDKDAVLVQAGCSAILDSLAWCLGEEGDACIVPAPVYPAFANDFWARARVHLKMAQTHHPDYSLTREVLDQAYGECLSEGKPPKMLLLCNPCNPTGRVYSRETLEMCVRWAEERGIHLISDEIYANSLFPGEAFVSVARVCADLHSGTRGDRYLGDFVHITYGLSKDWAMSGVRGGVLFTHNDKLTAAVSNLACFNGMSSYAQWVWTCVFEDRAWVSHYIRTNQEKLRACYAALEEALACVDVPVTPCQGTLMAWADFRRHLKEQSWAGELALWKDLFARSKILLTTGQSCHSAVPGFFRVCFAWPAVTPDDPTAAMRVLKSRLLKHFANA